MTHAEDRRRTRLDRAMASEVAEMMQALATPSRVMILDHLRAGPTSVGRLAAAVGMDQSAVSHQLRLLRQLGLIVGHRDGRQMLYELHDPHVGELLEEAIGHAEHVRLSRSSSRGAPAP